MIMTIHTNDDKQIPIELDGLRITSDWAQQSQIEPSTATSVTMADSVTSIAKFAFFRCSGLAWVVTPPNLLNRDQDGKLLGLGWAHIAPQITITDHDNTVLHEGSLKVDPNFLKTFNALSRLGQSALIRYQIRPPVETQDPFKETLNWWLQNYRNIEISELGKIDPSFVVSMLQDCGLPERAIITHLSLNDCFNLYFAMLTRDDLPANRSKMQGHLAGFFDQIRPHADDTTGKLNCDNPETSSASSGQKRHPQ